MVSLEKVKRVPDKPKSISQRDPKKDIQIFLKYIGVFIMKRTTEVAAIAAIVILLPMTGMAEDNRFTQQYKDDVAAESQEAGQPLYQEEKQGFFSKSWNTLTHTGKRVVNSAKGALDPDERNKELRAKVDLLNIEIKNLREQKMITRIQDTVEWEHATACIPMITRIIERAEPLPTNTITDATAAAAATTN